MNLNTMMAQALARRDRAIADVARMKEERRQEEIAAFERDLIRLFGSNFLDLLDRLECEHTEISGCAACFFYQDRAYQLRQHDGSYYRDSLLCALSDLAAWTETPRPTPRAAPPAATEPTAEERFLAALREIIAGA